MKQATIDIGKSDRDSRVQYFYLGAVQKIRKAKGWVGPSHFGYAVLRKKVEVGGTKTSALRNAREKSIKLN